MQPNLHIALQEGFDGSPVSMWLGGSEVYSKESVTTDLRIGLADTCDAPLPDGRTTLEVRAGDLPPGMLDIDSPAPGYVAVSVIAGSIRFRVSSTPFGYV